ncbi:MAG: ABC transporter permease [Methylobacteriaceae bacterium]|nr:ABC transporter permease [Methylobacteriaceae bacterium]
MSTTDAAPAQKGAAPTFRRETPLIPASSIAGRALVTVIAIMTFLAALAAGVSLLVYEASSDWRAAIGQELTMQVRPVVGRDLQQDVEKAAAVARAFPGVASVAVLDRRQSEALLEPWLGAGLDLKELPVPRLVTIRMTPGARPDYAAFRRRLAAEAPTASLDDHRFWLERLAAMANALVAVAVTVFALILVAMATAVAFATRGAMAGNREIVDVLHLVGAADGYIANEFQRHFFRLGLKGAAIGGVAAILAFAVGGVMARSWTSTAAELQFELLFGAFALSWLGYALIALVALGIAALTGLVSRSIVFRRLRGLD